MSFTKSISALTLGCMVVLLVPRAQALDILLTNDDGFEAASLHAVYQRLKEHGHSVIVSAPAMDNTAQSGALRFGGIGPLATASRGGVVPAGAPGVGSLPSDPDVFYVDSTPAISVLHGLDVAAQNKWGHAPDLVISGINYGLNTGSMDAFSGTFNAAVVALNRGVPAISVSAQYPRGAYRPFTQLNAADIDYEIADFVVKLVAALESAAHALAGPLLPPYSGLNVNVPAFEKGGCAALPVRSSQLGHISALRTTFVMDLSAQPTNSPTLPPALPGISSKPNADVESDPRDEQNVIAAGAIAISVVQASHEAPQALACSVFERLEGVVQ